MIAMSAQRHLAACHGRMPSMRLVSALAMETSDEWETGTVYPTLHN